MTSRIFENGFQVYNSKENPIINKVKGKTQSSSQLQRAALGDIRNKQTTFNNKENNLKKNGIKQEKQFVKPKSNISSMQLRNKLKDNVNVPAKLPVPDKVSKIEDSIMEVDETMESQVEELSAAFSSQRLNVDDIDAEDKDNPQLVSEYVKDIYKYMWHLENEFSIQCNYMEGQKVTYKMRSILIDWLIQVHMKFSLLQETLYLTIAILDRYLMTDRTTSKDHLQLVGVTSMFIASKYEEIYIPEIGDFSYITDKTFTKADIRRMEVRILKTLKFYISFPLPLHFLRRDSKAGLVDAAHHTLAKYLMELTLPEYSLCHINPSLLAAASLYLAMKLLDNDAEWSDNLTFYSNYPEGDILPIVYKLSSVVIKSTTTSKLKAIRSKYSSAKFMKISSLKELDSSNRILIKYNGLASSK